MRGMNLVVVLVSTGDEGLAFSSEAVIVSCGRDGILQRSVRDGEEVAKQGSQLIVISWPTKDRGGGVVGEQWKFVSAAV